MTTRTNLRKDWPVIRQLTVLTTVFLALLAIPVAGAGAPGGASQMVVAAHPLAAEAGREILRRGGSAIDAAVAVQLVLNVVEPQESGIGGGGFLFHRDGATGELTFYDGRETAPGAATPDRFLLPLGVRLPVYVAVVSGRSIGVPGLVALLHDAHAERGRLPWESLFARAIELAEVGVPMPGRLRRQVADDRSLWVFRSTRRYFARPAREAAPVIRNPELAAVLREIAAGGPDAFYRGPRAANLVEAARGRWLLPSDLDMDDLAAYTPLRRSPVCGRYRTWTLCGAPPPSSGGPAILQILGMLEHFDLGALEAGSAQAVHLVAEASRLAFADRQRYLGDPDHVDIPLEGLLDRAYLAERAALIDPRRAMTASPPGIPGVTPMIDDPPPVEEEEEFGTTHFSIVDAAGNAVALTSSIEAPFGARLMVDGYLLNNQLTDFDFRPTRGAEPAANAVAPGKRPRSSMSPTFVFDADGELVLVIGSRGGSRIIGYVLKTLIGVLDWGLTVEEAVRLPNVLHRGQTLELEAGTALEHLAPELARRGHTVNVRRLESGVHAIQYRDGGWWGVADPRMEGAALGD